MRVNFKTDSSTGRVSKDSAMAIPIMANMTRANLMGSVSIPGLTAKCSEGTF